MTGNLVLAAALIDRGLIAAERKRLNIPPDYSSRKDLPRDLQSLLKLGATAEAKAANIKLWAAGRLTELNEFRRAERKRVNTDDTLKQLSAEVRNTLIDRECEAKFAELWADDGKFGGLGDMMRQRDRLHEMARQGAAVWHLWSDPVAVLVRENLGNETARRFYLDMEHSGIAEVAGFLEMSRDTGNAPMFIACHRRLDAMGGDLRRTCPIDAREVAMTIAGARTIAASCACENMVLLSDEVDHSIREAREQPLSSQEKIDYGLRRRDLEKRVEAVAAPKFDPAAMETYQKQLKLIEGNPAAEPPPHPAARSNHKRLELQFAVAA